MNLSKSFRTILWMFCVSQALIYLSVAAKYFSGKLCVFTFFRLRFYYQFYRNISLYTNSSGNLIRILIIGKQFITNKKNISQQMFQKNLSMKLLINYISRIPKTYQFKTDYCCTFMFR